MQFFNPNSGPQEHPTQPGTFSTLVFFFQPRHLSPPYRVEISPAWVIFFLPSPWITSLGWALHLAKYLTKPAKSLPVPITILPDASDAERLLKLRSLGRMENGMMLLGIHQYRGSRQVVWIPTDPWPKLGRLERRKHLPDEDTSTDVWYLDRYDQYLERPIAAIPIKYPHYYRHYRRTQREPGGSNAAASNSAEGFAYDSPSSESDDGVSRDRFHANVRPDEGARPYWWPSPPEKLEKTFTDEVGTKRILQRPTAIPRWNFYLPYGEDAELYFL